METAGSQSKNSEQRSGATMPSIMRKRYELLDECRELVGSRLGNALVEAVNAISDNFSIAATESKDSKEQEFLLEAVSVVRMHQADIEKRFRKSFNDVFERRLFAKQGELAKAPSFDDADFELSLVSNDQVTSRLEVDKIIHRSKSRLNADEVLGVRARLGALLEREWFDEDQQPGSATDVFEALKGALTELSPTPEIATALLDAFEPYLTSNLNDAYSKVNQRLVALHILPKIKPQFQRGVENRVGRKQDAQELAGAMSELEAIQRAQGMAGMHPGMSTMFMSAHAFEGLLEGLGRGLPMARQQATKLLTDENLIGSLETPMPQVAPGLLEALHQMQSGSMNAPLVGRQHLAQLKEHVQENGTGLDRLTVDIVELVFDYIYGDHRLADPIKQQLLRLQVVAVKAALLDRSFFAKRQHPLRQILDRISELGSDPDIDADPAAALAQEITDIVGTVIVEFESDLSVFEQALLKLDDVQAREELRRNEWLEQKTIETQSEENRIDALDNARAEISQRIDNESPEFLREFLYRWWGPVIAKCATHESAPIDREKSINISEMLLWSVSPKLPDDVPKLAAMLPQLIGGVVKGLNFIECPQADRELFFNDLLKVHTTVIASAKAVPHAARTVGVPHASEVLAASQARRNIKIDTDGAVKFAPPKERASSASYAPTMSLREASVEGLDRGVKLDILQDSGEIMRYKLAWISPSRKLFLLSRYPHEPLSVSRNDMAIWIDTGRATIVNDDTIVTRAIGIAASGQSLQTAVAA